MPTVRPARATEPHPLPHHWSEHACLDFVNSTWTDHVGSGRRYDRLPLAEWRSAFLARWGLEGAGPMTPGVRRRLLRLRALLRRLLDDLAAGVPPGPADTARLDRLLARPPYRRRLTVHDGRCQLFSSPLRRDWSWVEAEIVASFARLLEDGSNPVKVCANPNCTWVFADVSRNRSRRWCESRYCGNLVNVRRFRGRPSS